MTDIRCCICKKGPYEGATVYRIHAKGVPGIFACREHLKMTDAPPIDLEVEEIIKVLE